MQMTINTISKKRFNKKTSYFDVNQEEKTTLIFIHGNSMSKELFQKQLTDDLFGKFRMIALDLIGFGESAQSENPSQEYNVPFYAEIINDLIKELNLQNVILIGHSLGGHVAIEFAGKYKNNIIGVVAVGTPPLGVPADINSAFLPNPAANLLFQSQLSSEEVLQLSKEVANENNQSLIIGSIKAADSIAREMIGGSIINQNYMDEIEILDSIEVPYSLVIGSEDKLCNLEYFKKHPFANQWRGEVRIIQNASHNPFIDNADVINKLIYEFCVEIK